MNYLNLFIKDSNSFVTVFLAAIFQLSGKKFYHFILITVLFLNLLIDINWKVGLLLSMMETLN